MWRFLSQSGPGGSRVGSEFWGREFLFQRPFGPRSSPRRPATPRQLRLRLTFCNFLVFLLLLLGLTTGPLLFSLWRGAESLGKEGLPGGIPPLLSAATCARLEEPPWICAHGGDTAQAPPNTFAAYDLALAAGVECVEVDASRSKDGVMVALHDRDLQVFSRRAGIRVGDLTLKELQSFDAGSTFSAKFRNQRVPTLEAALKVAHWEGLQMLTGRVRQVTVDVKFGPPLYERHLASDVMKAVERAGCGNCLVWTKHDQLVADFKRINPDIRAGYIVMNDSLTGRVGGLLRLEAPEVIAIYWELATWQTVKEAHKGGKAVHVWTVNDRLGMHRMLESGVDAIVTNQPGVLRETITTSVALCKLRGLLGKKGSQ